MDSEVIREARVEDVTVIVDMIRAGSNEGVFHSQAFSLEEQREAFRKNAFEEQREGYQVLVSQVRSRIVGYIIVGYIDYRVRRGVGHVLGIYVKQGYRRQGIGKRLIKRTLDDFKRKGCHKTRCMHASLQITMGQLSSIDIVASLKKAFSVWMKRRKMR